MTRLSHSIVTPVPGRKVRLKNVLYATDFSRAADKAFPYAAEFARRFGSSFTVVHVKTREEYLEAPLKQRAVVAADFTSKENALRSVLRSDLPSLKAQVLSLRGKVWNRLQSVIEKKKIGLLVLGTSGRGGLKKFLLGSVAEMVVGRATCPVLTVGPKAPSEPPFEGKFREMLYATDLSEASAAALPYVVQFASEQNATLTLLHVIERYPKDIPMTSDEIDASLIDQMEEMVPGNCAKGAVSYLVREGKPAETILRMARDRHADLIILGMKKTGSRPPSALHLPFAIAHKVIAQAGCAVLSIRS